MPLCLSLTIEKSLVFGLWSLVFGLFLSHVLLKAANLLLINDHLQTGDQGPAGRNACKASCFANVLTHAFRNKIPCSELGSGAPTL